MKLLFILLIIFSPHHSVGQKFAKEMNAWDNLYNRISAKEKQHDEILRKNQSFTDTLKLKNQIIITYYASDKRKLRKMSNYLETDGCIKGISYDYYNSKELIEFQTNNKKCCPQDTVGGYHCFERMTYYARFEYDAKDREVVRVYHVTTPGTYRVTTTYSQDGNKEEKREKIDETMFWD